MQIYLCKCGAKAWIYIWEKKGVWIWIPVDLICEPIEILLSATASLTKPLSCFLASDLILAAPVIVDNVALAAINAVKDDDCFGVYTKDPIKEVAAGVNVWAYECTNTKRFSKVYGQVSRGMY